MRWIGFAVTALAVAVTGGCANSATSDAPAAVTVVPAQPQVLHVVLCWQKQPGSDVVRQTLMNTSRSFLGEVPGLLSVRAGTALPSTRPAVDSSFDLAIVMTFQDEASLHAYETNPKHVEAIRDILQPLVQRLVIYDVVVPAQQDVAAPGKDATSTKTKQGQPREKRRYPWGWDAGG